MRTRWLILLLSLLCLAGAWLFWHQPAPTQTKPSTFTPAAAPTPVITASNRVAAATAAPPASLAKTNPFAWRLSNTLRTIGQLVGDRHAILLENAFIDTSLKLDLSIPKNLQSPGDPGAYIVQARGPIDATFRALLASAGATVVSYIPNDAYLVRIGKGGADGLAGNALVQAVVPYEPYYKISSSMPVMVEQKTFSSVPAKTNRVVGPSLLVFAVKQAPLPAGTYLTLGLFNDGAAATVAQIEKLGGRIVERDNSPFGPVVRVQPPADWIALAALPGVQCVEPYCQRVHANDLSRATVGVAADTQVSSNYLNLSGSNVLVEVDDSGTDAGHPDLMGRVFGAPIIDLDGHGTHVAGIIAGSGLMSTTVTNAQGSILTNIISGVPSGTPGQFRGMAPLATLFSMDFNEADRTLQEAAALTNVLISNNSWNYSDAAYDLAAASYDAAVRDALPGRTGSQSVLFVFSAGNNGGGNSGGGGGDPDTILSPATAKNVITVGALEQLRGITNIVTDRNSNSSAIWHPETDSGFQVADYSSRGNVGIGTEGTFGRYKPDVVAPGSFVISTRSEQWNEQAYYNPTNRAFSTFIQQAVDPQTLNYYNVFVPGNAVGVVIQIVPNLLSPIPFPTNLPIYVEQADLPTTNVFDFLTTNNEVSIPPDSGNAITGIQSVQNLGFWYAVGNNTGNTVNYDLIVEIITTNDLGNYFQVLSNLNQSIGTFNPNNLPASVRPYYRYESGTSMSAADVSGVLALMQDYFTNVLQVPPPSPALLKGMLINGARRDGNYDFQVQSSINYQGWGLVNLPGSLPLGMTTNLAATGESMLLLDQSPALALATGDSHTYLVSITNSAAQTLPVRITLAWTDPPGNPAAAIKLVNDLNLVVTNLSNSTNFIVYYGNDISASSIYNTPENLTNAPNFDPINNVENVYLPPGAVTNSFSITVFGTRVNVNAVTAQTNDVVQDYALVISCGEGEVTNAFTVTDNGSVTNSTADQQVTVVLSTNAPLLNQFVGASTPLLGTNTLPIGTNTIWGTNGIVTLGMTNQWHFYAVTNTGISADFTNAAFITFFDLPPTLSIPRMGAFAGSAGNATRLEADIDLYVAGPNDPNASGLTNLNPTVISNCLAGASGDAASLGRAGTEFVTYTNSAPGQVYYVGVYSEDQEASEYGFIPIFTDIPFSTPGPNGSEIVNGLNVPVNIPDGSTTHPGIGYVFAVALFPMDVGRVVVTNIVTHQNFGDLIGTLTHGEQNGQSQAIVLNNHDSLFNPLATYTHIYDDSGRGDVFNSQPSDGPGSLNNFLGQPGVGPWILTEVDDSLSQTGAVTGFNLWIQPHQDLTKGLVTTTLGPLGWFYDFIDVPPGATNLSIFATNITATGTVDLFVRFGAQPTLTNFDVMVQLTNSDPTGMGGSISIGPPLTSGRYWVGLFNESVLPQTVQITATLGMGSVPAQSIFTSAAPVPILDDAVSTNLLFESVDQIVASVDVGLRVDHPRVSDLVFHLIGPDGTRCLLVENRGGTSTNGMGATFNNTTIVPVSASGGSVATTNVFDTGQTFGTLTVQYNFYGIPDRMVVYDSVPNLIFDSGLISFSGAFNIAFTNGPLLTIVMNPGGGNPNTGWDYMVNALQARYAYLVLTEDTKKANLPIKFAPTPFVPVLPLTSNVFTDSFEGAAAGDYTNGQTFVNGWTVLSNQVTVVADPTTARQGNNLLALADGVISNNLPTVAGQAYALTFAYRGPGAVSLWRGEGNTLDSVDGNNPTNVQGITYAAGQVGQAFNFDGVTSLITMPASSNLAVASFTFDGWIFPNTADYEPIVEYGGAGQFTSLHMWVNGEGLTPSPGMLYLNLRPSNPSMFTPAGTVPIGAWTYVTATVDAQTGIGFLYVNGVQITNCVMSVPINSPTFQPVNIGYRDAASSDVFNGTRFNGLLDEINIYNRALSPSEIKAIYNRGLAGIPKYDTSAASPALGLSEAQVTLNGNTGGAFFGNDTNWQIQTITFTATTNGTPLVITGIEPGMLLDNFSLATVNTNNFDLYYLPEQSLDAFAGKSGLGPWQLEVWDNRVGAGLTNTLVSWQLRFNFATNFSSIGALSNGQAQSNLFVLPGSIVYFQVQVPCNADIATNTLLTATGPLNFLFNETTPPTGTTPPDYQILGPVTNGSAILTTTSNPTNIVPCGSYIIGVQNPGTSNVTFGVQVTFHLLPASLALPQLPELIAYTGQPFVVTNAATGGAPAYTYALTTSVPGLNVPIIDPATGVITWTPDTNQAPAVYTLTNIVTDSALQTATDIFQVLVVLTNGLPAFPGAEGAGGFAIGGRGGDVYHVINLNDDGPGSLRYGTRTTFGSRTIVFDVSGTIDLLSELRINKPYLTIAAQTAPGAGIAIQGLTTSVENTHDMVVRFLRCRPGDIYTPAFQDDSFHFRGVTNSIADHISASWSIDEVLSTTLSTNVTVQWSMIAEPLDHSGHLMDSGGPGFQEHGFGSLIRYGYGAVSYHHNLYADNFARNPRLGDNIRLDFINNVVCNWGILAGYNEDDTDPTLNPGGYTNFLNYVGNFAIAGSNSANPNIAFRVNVPNPTFTQIYEATNFIDSNPFTNVLNGVDTGLGMFAGSFTALLGPTPMPEIPVTTNDPALAYEQVLDFAGASVAGASVAGTSLLRDPVDTNIVAGVRNKSGQIVDFISSNRFAGTYVTTNFGVTYAGNAGPATYWQGQGVTQFVGVNPWPLLNPAPQPLDSDQDGLPDYWELTLAATGEASMNRSVPNNNHSNPDGYTDLEHYNNWLAAPHALTVSNIQVAVDLYAIVGLTGNLSFGVTNGTNGTVSLGADGHTATFLPGSTNIGFASFGFSVTNRATTNRFDATVSVMISATNITYSSVLLTNAAPLTNTVVGDITYFLINVPPNAQIATNTLLFSTLPVNLLFSQVGLPTGTNTGDYTLLGGSLGGTSILTSNSVPTNIVAGGSYYLGVQNTNGVPVNFALEVDFFPAPPAPPGPPPVITITSITFTNIGGTNGFLLQWQGPTNLQYEIQWTTNLTPVVSWNSVLNPSINVLVTATNGHYSWFDDGSLTGGFGLLKFYRVLAGLNVGPITGSGPSTNIVLAGAMSQAVVTVPANALWASNVLLSATGPLNVWFNQTNPPTGNTNAGDFLMLSATNAGVFVLASNSVPPLVPGTNYFLGFQNPGTSNVLFTFQVTFGLAPTNAVFNFSLSATNGGILLRWNGQTNYQYQVQWTTNLTPPVTWNTVSNIVLTSTTGIFTFLDDGSLTGGLGGHKFYRLITYPYLTPIPQALSISSVTVTNLAGTNDLVLSWSAPTNYQYGIQWTTNLALPFSSWISITNPVLTLTNGVYTFVDNGQTGPSSGAKFFRLLEY